MRLNEHLKEINNTPAIVPILIKKIGLILKEVNTEELKPTEALVLIDLCLSKLHGSGFMLSHKRFNQYRKNQKSELVMTIRMSPKEVKFFNEITNLSRTLGRTPRLEDLKNLDLTIPKARKRLILHAWTKRKP